MSQDKDIPQKIDLSGLQEDQLIIEYAKTWSLLWAYDEDKLIAPNIEPSSSKKFEYNLAKRAIEDFKSELYLREEATKLFAAERNEGALESILGNIEQTFDKMPLYQSPQEKAANLLYFVVKDHPFIDGNKRIGSFLFLLYLRLQNLSPPVNPNGLSALTLLLAESNPNQKEMMVRLLVNLLTEVKATTPILEKIEGISYFVAEIYKVNEKPKIQKIHPAKLGYDIKDIKVEGESGWTGIFFFEVKEDQPFYRTELIEDLKTKCLSEKDFLMLKKNLREIRAQCFSDGTVFFYYYGIKEEIMPW